MLDCLGSADVAVIEKRTHNVIVSNVTLSLPSGCSRTRTTRSSRLAIAALPPIGLLQVPIAA